MMSRTGSARTAMADPEVVPMAGRRRFRAEEKRPILGEAGFLVLSPRPSLLQPDPRVLQLEAHALVQAPGMDQFLIDVQMMSSTGDGPSRASNS
jgi:hypothetical protein